MLCPKEAAMRIFEIVDNMEDINLIETTMTISNRSSFSVIMNKRRSLAKEKSIKSREISMETFQLNL